MCFLCSPFLNDPQNGFRSRIFVTIHSVSECLMVLLRVFCVFFNCFVILIGQFENN